VLYYFKNTEILCTNKTRTECRAGTEGRRVERSEDKRSFKLRTTAAALSAAVNIYENILNGDMDYTPELKKAVQTSIKELCTALSADIKEN